MEVGSSVGPQLTLGNPFFLGCHFATDRIGVEDLGVGQPRGVVETRIVGRDVEELIGGVADRDECEYKNSESRNLKPQKIAAVKTRTIASTHGNLLMMVPARLSKL